MKIGGASIAWCIELCLDSTAILNGWTHRQVLHACKQATAAKDTTEKAVPKKRIPKCLSSHPHRPKCFA